MKELPNNLGGFNLHLIFNNLGFNDENVRWLGWGMKYLPSNLKGLELDLTYNSLGGNAKKNM